MFMISLIGSSLEADFLKQPFLLCWRRLSPPPTFAPTENHILLTHEQPKRQNHAAGVKFR